MKEQIIHLSEGCPYKCPFCFNGKNKFKDYLLIPKIKSNYVILHDDAFLSKSNVLITINELGSIKANNKVVYYEILQGINVKDLNQEIADALYKNRFKHIRIAWDGSYTKKNYYKVYDGIQMLVKAGYKRKELMCYILSNYYVSLRECLYKSKVLLQQHIQICICDYRKNLLDPKIYYDHWTKEEVEYFRQEVRFNNQLIRYNGHDPELEKRLIVAKQMPK